MNWTKILVILGVVAAAGATAQAGGWYGLVELGAACQTFKSQYTYTDGSPAEGYTDQAGGVELDLGLGYSILERGAFALEVQGRFGYNSAKWSMQAEEGYSYSKKAPYAFAAEIVPAVRVSGSAYLTALAGVGATYIQETNSFKEWQPAFTLGAGLRFRVGDQARLLLQYRHTWYPEYSFTVHLPDGSLLGTGTDAPYTDAVTAGLAWRF